jgi:RecQ family ATP-dependent DNA helicase
MEHYMLNLNQDPTLTLHLPKQVQMDEYEKKNQNTKEYKNAKKILKERFGYNVFKQYQYQIIDNVVKCNDVLAIMPTGYGKSLCFQIVPLLTNEIAIVISPLIALMADQKMSLDKLGITSCCYNSSLSVKMKKEIETDLIQGKYQIMYTTPESLANPCVLKLINQMYNLHGICMVAIDEAHCVSSYGFDFRPKYRDIVKIRETLNNVPIMAVTATATDKVALDIKKTLNMNDCVTIKTSFDRPNLMVHVKIQSQNTFDEIVQIITDSSGPCIMYCLTKADTESMAKKLVDAGISAMAYHAGLSRDERSEIQEQFMNDEYSCITATIAFGMGINKTDVRTVIHYGCPQNIESYYQEIGRAGRDGNESDCYLFYKQKDFIIQQRFINEIKDPVYKTVRLMLLHKMSQYVNAKSCRRNIILEYFGNKSEKDNCAKCDICCHGVEKKGIVILDKCDEQQIVHVLGLIHELKSMHDYACGPSVISQILKGSASKRIKNWMKGLRFYGSLNNRTLKHILTMISKTVDHGLIESYDAGDCMFVLKCTLKGLNLYNAKKHEYLAKNEFDVVEMFDVI